MSNVLAIGDVHEPVSHPAYRRFCMDLRNEYKCDSVVFIGDVCDWHAISFHAHHPDAPGPKDEYELALAGVQKWARAFPKAKVCVGNHDARLIRLAESVNIPSRFIRDYAEIWNTPEWDWADEHTVDDVYYFHGTGMGGVHPAYNAAVKMGMSVVMGHIHSASGVKYRANPLRRWWGLDTGCGVDDKALAFAYNAANKIRSILSAAVIIDGVPHHRIMAAGPGEKYSRRRFK